MTRYEYEAEYEALPELESEYEYELESEYELEGEYEAEEFFGRLAGLARQAAASPQMRRLALNAGRMALRGGMGALGGYLGGQLPPQYRRLGQAAGAGLGYGLGTYLGGALPQTEFEGEAEWEYEAEMNPLIRVQPRALMEHLGHAATEAESEEEAEAFIGALVPIAARLIPRVAPAVMRAAPQLIRGVSGVVRTLRRNPATRQLVRTVPAIMRRTVTRMARQTAQGQPVTPQRAVRTLAQQTVRVIGNPQRSVQAYQQSRALDRQHHRAVGPAAAAVPGARPALCSSCRAQSMA
jgi:hypothetical protein